ncbi:DUF2567 domain-containing protein [uncultured Jatrophihabitans sp.]|uniref:DUF2567 domain-containing protein n=1 Tax=uncultured Jatrophihabitans sp. TaxID=1610747 RepID=UPI0035CBA77F
MTAAAPAESSVQPSVVASGEASVEARADLRAAAVAAVGLSLLGALLGLVWAWWSPTRPPAALYRDGAVAVLGESESLVAGDGRFLVLGTAVGLAAGLLGWLARGANRGPLVLFGLVVGGAAGALLTELVGHLTGGGSFHGRAYRLSDGTTAQVTLHLPLSLHMPGLLLVEPGLAALLYGLLAAFTTHDDLGRPDPVRAALRGRRPDEPADPFEPAGPQQPTDPVEPFEPQQPTGPQLPAESVHRGPETQHGG